MSVYVQLISIIVSFLYGVFTSIFIKFNNKYFTNSFLFKLLYSYVLVILYIIIIFKINKGIFHIYFLLSVLLGYYVSVKYICKRIQKR